MPVFSFEGRRETTGEIVSGLREAASHVALGRDLLAEGILLTRFEERRQRITGNSVFAGLLSHVPILEKLLFARYFALMLRAGLDVKRSLSALRDQTRSKPLKSALETIYRKIEEGQTLANSLAEFPHIFSDLFVSFIRVGESTGKLQESLEILAKQLDKDYQLRRAVRGGLLYPAIILVALFATGFAMMVFVVPKLVEVFDGFDVELPLSTRVLIAVSGFVEVYWYLVLLLIVFVAFGGWFLLKVKSVKMSVMQAFLYSPVIGPIMQKVNLARFSRSLSSLLSSGVAFVEALQIMSDNTPHPGYAAVLERSIDHVKQGKPLSEFLNDHGRLFPPLVTNIMKIGEETGELSNVLNEVALFYESEVDQTMKNLTSIMEPILMIFIGIAVGALAISVISPIYGLVNVI